MCMELLNDVIIQCEECGNIIVIKRKSIWMQKHLHMKDKWVQKLCMTYMKNVETI